MGRFGCAAPLCDRDASDRTLFLHFECSLPNEEIWRNGRAEKSDERHLLTLVGSADRRRALFDDRQRSAERGFRELLIVLAVEFLQVLVATAGIPFSITSEGRTHLERRIKETAKADSHSRALKRIGPQSNRALEQLGEAKTWLSRADDLRTRKDSSGAVANALKGKPTVDEMLAGKESAHHPFRGF